MLSRLYRDKAAMPAQFAQALDVQNSHYRDVLLKPVAATGAHRRRLRGLLGHAISFSTWRSLCVEQRLSDREAVDAMVVLVDTTR
jgi:hypothetical protein